MPATRPPATHVSESATTALYRAALGPVNTAHYLPVFERFDEAGRASPVWNPAAGFLTLNWMVFRQLWGAALVYGVGVGGLALLAIGLGRRFLQWPQGVEWGALGALLLLSIAIPGAYGHAILHAHTRRRMTRAVRDANTVREACATLARQASSRRRLWVLAAVNGLLVAAAGVSLAPGSRGPAWVRHKPVETRVAAAPRAAPVAGAVLVPALVSTPAPAATPEPPAPPASPNTLTKPEPEPTPSPVAVASPPASPEPGLLPHAVKPTLDNLPPQAHGINVGLFADRTNAEKTHARLTDAGFAAILQTVERPSGTLTRVRVGPFAGRAQADEAAARIRAMGLDAVVFRP